jgi:hypothetical protein
MFDDEHCNGGRRMRAFAAKPSIARRRAIDHEAVIGA